MKVLSISNNLLSLNNANGKFCRNYLNAFSDDELASFFISNDIKSVGEKIESFNYTDRNVLNDFLHKKSNDLKAQESNSQAINKNSAFVRILRYLLWKIIFRKNKKFYDWVKTLKPTHIATTVGDNPYLLFLARKLTKMFNCKLIIVCGENYALKKYNYLKCKIHRGLFFLIFQKILRCQTKKCFKKSDLVIFNSNQIRDLYKERMEYRKSIVMYPLSSNEFVDVYDFSNQDIVYAGNLGVGRVETIVKFSEVLGNIDKNHKIKVYGKGTSEQIELLSKEENIKYMGVVTNNELIEIINKSWLLLHVESFDDYRKIDLEYAFSTKLSDLISSNNRFFMFAPDCYVESKFFIEHLRNHIALNENELRESLTQLVAQKVPFIGDDNIELRNKMDIQKNGNYIRELIEKL